MNSPHPERKSRQRGRLATADARPQAGAKLFHRAVLDLDAIPAERPLYARATACGDEVRPSADGRKLPAIVPDTEALLMRARDAIP